MPEDAAPGVDVAALVAALAARGLRVATAESLTAGLVSARIADVPGASAVLRGGVVAYATELKASVLGVDAALLDEVGPVHAQVALQMARGVAALTGAGAAVATSGVAGPGPADGHPAGTVVVAAVLVGGGGCDGAAGPDGVGPDGVGPDGAGPGAPVERAGPVVAVEAVEVLHLPGDRGTVRAAAAEGALALLAAVLAGNS